MATRNVVRNRRRTAITVAAMAFALCVELLYSGLIPGYLRAMEEDITQFEIGDVQVLAPGYLDSPSIYTRIEDPAALLARIDQLGIPATPRLLGGGLAAAGEYSAGVAFRGVDVARDRKVTRVQDRVAHGKWLDPTEPAGVVVGKRLARTLSVKPGAELLLLSQATDGSTANGLYTVRGVLANIADATDRATVYMTEGAFRELMVMPQGAHQLVIKRAGNATLEETGAAISAAAPDLDVKTWKELMPIIAQMLDSVHGMIYIMYFIIYVAVGILILNAMLMAVFERIKEFGVLKAIGAGPLRVMSLILIECALQAAMAVALGFAAALPGMWYLSKHGIDFGAMGGMDAMGIAMRKIWYGVYSPESVAGPVIMLLFMVGLASLYPALKAAWISPIRAMRHR